MARDYQTPCTKDLCWNDNRRRTLDCQLGHKRVGWGGRFEFFTYGRCKSGKRWFWVVEHWNDNSDESGYRDWWHGWEDSEDAAKQASKAVVLKVAKGVPAYVMGRADRASDRLKALNKVKKASRPPADGSDSAVVEYLYNFDGDAFQIIKRTKKRIFFLWGQNFYRREKDETGFVDRRRVLEEWPATERALWSDDFGPRINGKRYSAYRCYFLKPKPAYTDEPELPDLKALKVAMAAAHPDKGGSDAAFIAARQAYEDAKVMCARLRK
jgi:hypothetical protein